MQGEIIVYFVRLDWCLGMYVRTYVCMYIYTYVYEFVCILCLFLESLFVKVMPSAGCD